MHIARAGQLAFLCFMVALQALMSAPGCSSARSARENPYTTPSADSRDPLRAQELTQNAAKLMHTDHQQAESLLREALNADLYHGPAHNNLGVLYLHQDKLYEAAGEFEWARKLMPGHPDPRMNLGLTLEKAGRYEEALASYDAALEAYPGHVPTMQALCRLQLRHGLENARTGEYLDLVSLQGETAQWRDWAASRALSTRR